MVYSDYIDTVLTLLGNDDVSDDEVEVYLQIAERKALDRIFPFSEGELPEKYELDVCELAVRLLSRKGGEGEMQHSENGVARIYGNVDDSDILSRFIPYGKVC